MKLLVYQHAFDNKKLPSEQTDYLKGVVVPAGRDSLHALGATSLAESLGEREPRGAAERDDEFGARGLAPQPEREQRRLDEARANRQELWAYHFKARGASRARPAPRARRPRVRVPRALADARAVPRCDTMRCVAPRRAASFSPQEAFPPSEERPRPEAQDGGKVKTHVVDLEVYSEDMNDKPRAHKLKELTQRAARLKAEAAAEAAAVAARAATRPR
jgi:hypothetical protein